MLVGMDHVFIATSKCDGMSLLGLWRMWMNLNAEKAYKDRQLMNLNLVHQYTSRYDANGHIEGPVQACSASIGSSL